jgi:tetraacyldisaccharide 4'-kinase
VILLDDAFQHRAVKPSFSILLTDFSKPFFQDHVLPMGRLREPRGGCARADVLVITKCPDLSGKNASELVDKVRVYAGPKPVFFSGVGYKAPVALEGDQPISKNIVLVTGIASSRSIVDYVSANFNMIQHVNFSDHHDYSREDIKLIQQKSDPAAHILTTEKDYVKLIAPQWRDVIDKKRWFYLPIESYFLKNGSEFDEMVEKKIITRP